MKNETGISVGIFDELGTTINWYRAYAVSRDKKDGAMIIYALDDSRTAFKIPAKKFSSVSPGIRGFFSKELHPDIMESPEMDKYKRK